MPAGTSLYRICRLSHPDPAYFGLGPRARFDAPDASYGVCYLGTSLACAFLETLPYDMRADPDGNMYIAKRDVAQRYAALAQTTAPMRLAHLANNGLARLGIDQRHTGGDDYDLSGAWSCAIQQHRSLPHGIFYPSRHHNGLYCVALFDRAAGLLSFRRWGILGDSATPDLFVEFARLLRRFRVALV
jgi:hypothetical protein